VPTGARTGRRPPQLLDLLDPVGVVGEQSDEALIAECRGGRGVESLLAEVGVRPAPHRWTAIERRSRRWSAADQRDEREEGEPMGALADMGSPVCVRV
jgi:hypothetical protein